MHVLTSDVTLRHGLYDWLLFNTTLGCICHKNGKQKRKQKLKQRQLKIPVTLG